MAAMCAAISTSLHSSEAPSLPLPFRTPQLRPARNAVRVVRHLSGLGAVAAKDLPAGTTLVCEKALAMVLDAQVAEIEEDDTDTNPNKVITSQLTKSTPTARCSFCESPPE